MIVRWNLLLEAYSRNFKAAKGKERMRAFLTLLYFPLRLIRATTRSLRGEYAQKATGLVFVRGKGGNFGNLGSRGCPVRRPFPGEKRVVLALYA